MKIFNTLTNKIEEFKVQSDDIVGMYTCGPTVYDTAHIGNLRKYICDDLLHRALQNSGYTVTHVMNVTDVDDKTIKKSEGDRARFASLTKNYEKDFFRDLEKLNIIRPDKITRATEYIDKMVAFIKDLLDKGYAYRSEDGSIYFSIAKFENYGKLSKLDKQNLKSGARVAQDEYDKENPSDFALWKSWSESDGEIFWETELGKGRPGWHIECSTMSMDILGETIDIHTGGVDNIFPHHENEIAQSEARSGKKFVNFWVHNEHLLVDGKKMSKSLGNFYKLCDVEEKGFSSLDFRYFVASAHYRSKINFTWQALQAARNARLRLVRIVSGLSKIGKIEENYMNDFVAAIQNDLDMPTSMAVLWSLVRDENVFPGDKFHTLSYFDKFLGLGIFQEADQEIPEKIIELAELRKLAREEKEFKKSDEYRDQIASLGFIIIDKPNNQYEIEKS